MTEQTEKKLFLLDAYALIYRSYYAFIKNPRINSKGLNTSAIFGFTNTVLDLIKKEKPTHLAVIFDVGEPTSRTEDFSGYKANREATPEDIKLSIPYIHEILSAMHIPAFGIEGYEADDVIGTLANQAEAQGYTVYMMTPDKDYGQLVTENILMYKPAAFGKGPEILGIKEVCEKFGLNNTKQVIDLLGLMGDAVDNIPGVPKVGPKTASQLISQYGSMEVLYENLHEQKGKLKENLETYRDQAFMSKMLATIITDCPCEFDEEQYLLEEPDKEQLLKVFSELEFRNLAQRVFGEDIQVTPVQKVSGQMDLFSQPEAVAENQDEELPLEIKNIENTSHNYVLVEDEKGVTELVKKLEREKEFCFDTETTGLDAFEAEIIGLSIAYKKGEAYYVAIPKDFNKAKAILQHFSSVFNNENILKIAHNIKYDASVLKKYGIIIKGKQFDTMIAHYLIQPDMRHGMDLLSETYLGYRPISIESLIGKKGKNQLNMGDIPPSQIKDYAAEDADITLQLKKKFESVVSEGHIKNIFEDIEMPLVEVLSSMEEEGINLDVKALNEFSKELGNELDVLSASIIELAGTDFNIDSPKQLGQILFEVLKVIDKPKKTKTGQYQTSEDVLSTLVNTHEIIPKILDYRSVKKLKSTYVDTLPEMVNKKSGRIHTSYMQTVAATGRLSSNNPNLQNIPIRTAKGREIRKAFIAKDENHSLIAADYSQIELRIIAAMSGDKNMQQAFIDGLDIHAATAAKIFGVSENEVDREMRSKAKAVNFGLIYGQSAFGLAQNLNIPRSEAREIIDSYFTQYPKIKKYMDESVNNAKDLGYVETMLGRRRILKDINSVNAIVRGHAERNAINAPIQGTAADIIKIAMINIYKKLKASKLKSKMILQVHDELVFDVPNNEIDEVSNLIKYEMENAVKMDVPLVVEVDKGKNWLEAH